ncbi:MAG: hypothetical protein IJ871_02490 [Ruminococcus sp.]|nr:hypothetical protein [Ruminococcus sp.]
MRSRCKFCGYHFSSDDEMICPECLTAREEDIDCGIYADSEHTHTLDPFDRDFHAEGTDMYKEKKNDFIAQERREEAHDPNFRSEPRPMPQQTYNPAQLNTSPLSRSQLYAQQQANNPNFRNMSPQMQQQYMNFMNSRANQKNAQNQAGKGCGIAFVVFFFIVFIMAMIGGIANSNYAKDCFAEETSSAVITEQSELLI